MDDPNARATSSDGLQGLLGSEELPVVPSSCLAPARELYVSQLFRKASAYAELTCDRWYILSAKHGLVHPDQVLEPYDVKLGTNARTSPPIHQWAAMVQEQLAAELTGIGNPKLIVLAGEQYRDAVYSGPWEYEVPMQGLGIGQQLGWLTEQLSGEMRHEAAQAPSRRMQA